MKILKKLKMAENLDLTPFSKTEIAEFTFRLLFLLI